MKVNGMPDYRMLLVNNASEPPANLLHMYMYDSDYQLKDNPLPPRQRLLQTNDEPTQPTPRVAKVTKINFD